MGGDRPPIPIDCLQLQKFTNGTFQPVGGLTCRTDR